MSEARVSQPFCIALTAPDNGTAKSRHLSDVIRKGVLPDQYADMELATLSQVDETKRSALPDTVPLPASGSTTSDECTESTENCLAQFASDASPTRNYGDVPYATLFNRLALSSHVSGGEFTPHDGTYISPSTSTRRPGAHTYKMNLAVNQVHSNFRNGNKDIIVKLELDSGSNMSWVFINGYCMAEEIVQPEPRSTARTQYKLKELGNTHLHKTGVLLQFSQLKRQYPCVISAPLDAIGYGDHSKALLDRAPETVKAKIMGSFVWGQQSQRASLSLDYRFGIAYAATDMLCDDPTLDGIIGMGTFDFQSTFYENHHCLKDPSFLRALQSPKLPEPSNGEGGIIVYFILRVKMIEPPEQRRPIYYKSYMGLQEWPMVGSPRPAFVKLPVYRTDDYTRDLWTVRVQYIAVCKMEKDAGGRNRTYDKLDYAHYPFRAMQRCALDTGTSLTYLPADTVRAIREGFFNQQDDTWRQAAWGPFSQYAIEWVFFTSITGYDTVTIHAPVENFLCDSNGHCLLRDLRNGAPEALLGVNFFHAMFVALHLPDTSREEPYVELAPQWPEEIASYTVPPLV